MIPTSRAAPVVLVILLAVRDAATGADVFVSSVDELSAAAASASPGDTLVVQDGTRAEWRFALRAAGTAASPITLRAETPGGVRFTGNVRIEITGSHLVVSGFLFEEALSSRHASIVEFRNARHCRLTDCSFVNCGDPQSTFTRTINMAYGSSHNRVDHCHMTGTLSMGMGVVVRDSEAGRGNTDNRFDHNYFKDIRRLSSNGQEPIQLGQDQTAFGHVSVRAVVEHNLFENASGDGEIISNKSADNVIRRNTMRDSKAGICLRGGRNTLVEGNYCRRTRGIRIFGDGHTVINNYLEETEYGICLDAGQHSKGDFVSREVSGSYEAASGVLIANNSIVNPTVSGIALGLKKNQKHQGVARSVLPCDVTIVNNLVTGIRGVLIIDHGSRDVKWRANIAWPRQEARLGLSDQGIVETDPRLIRGSDLRYLPGSDSPALDAGILLEAVVADYAGRRRVGSPDIGCDEVSQADVVNGPLGPDDVGPSWKH